MEKWVIWRNWHGEKQYFTTLCDWFSVFSPELEKATLFGNYQSAFCMKHTLEEHLAEETKIERLYI